MEVHRKSVKLSNLLLIFMTITYFVINIEGYNLEVRLPIIKQGEAGSYFGFSVAGHATTKTRPSADDGFANALVLVGAPKFNTSEPGLTKPSGGIFRCPVSSRVDDCTHDNYDTAENEVGEDKSDQWLGVRVSSQGAGGKVGVCAHRYKKVNSAEISGLGKCWKINADLTPDVLGAEWKPCDNGQSGKRFYGYCQAGTGLYMIPESKDPRKWFLAGAPGAGDWRGGFFATTGFDLENPTFDNLESYLVDINNDEDTEENLEQLGVNFNSYLGFSVTAGKFSDEGIQIVAGAPRAENIGAVVIFEPKRGGETQIKKHIVMPGKYMTESYGYSVCTADLNGDGYDDLIIGAPLYYDRNTDAGGRVYIYLNKNKNADFSEVEPIQLTGPLDSMFGISIINLGDLDLDGKQDIAIGSPYENKGAGAVYIYHGSEDGIKQPEVQKITPSSLPDVLPINWAFNYTFGYSLSGGVDLDGNDYPELIVGAFQTDTIVAFRARPIVTLRVTVNSSQPTLDPDVYDCEKTINGKPAMCFDVSVIVRQDSRSEYFEDQTVDLRFSIEAEAERRNELHKPSRVIFEDTGTYEVTNQEMTIKAKWDEEDTISKKYKVIIQKGFTDIYRPIPFKLSYQLVEKEPVMPNPGDPLPDMREFPILEGAIDGVVVKDEPLLVDFEKECAKDDGVCITDLSLVVTTNMPGEPPILRVGEQDELEIKIALKNLNEEAYDAKIVIEFPESLHFNVFSAMAIKKCITSDSEPTLITCNLGNPYPPATKTELYGFKFDASDVPSDSDNFTITINATAANQDSNPQDNSVVIQAEVRGITDLQISGKTNWEQYFYSGEVIGESAFEYEEDIGMLVTHTWKVISMVGLLQQWSVHKQGDVRSQKIFNLGPGIVEQSLVTIYFPYEAFSGKWLLYMTDLPQLLGDKGSCDIDPKYVNPVGYKKRTSLKNEDSDDDDTKSEFNLPGTAEPTSSSDTEETNKGTKEETDKGTKEETDKGTDTNQRRRRREVDDDVVLKSSKRETAKASQQAIKGKSVSLDCLADSLDAPKCFQFNCTLDALYKNDEAQIVLKSRLWNSTLIEDFIEFDLVQIVSHGMVEIVGTPYLTQHNTKNDQSKLITNVWRDQKLVPPPRVKWWIILLAVLCGLILLIIFIIILWKCGFFERKQGHNKWWQCGFFERKHREYKYAEVSQMSAAKGKVDKRMYYDDAYIYKQNQESEDAVAEKNEQKEL